MNDESPPPVGDQTRIASRNDDVTLQQEQEQQKEQPDCRSREKNEDTNAATKRSPEPSNGYSVSREEDWNAHTDSFHPLRKTR